MKPARERALKKRVPKKRTREQVQKSLFMRRTYHMYKHMLERYKQTFPEKPKRVRAAAELPFVLDDLREYMQSRMGKPCRYCKEPLKPKTMACDHRIPVSRGGDWRLANCQAVCQSCNLAKGNLTSKEFDRVYGVLATIDPVAKRQFIGRLKAGASVARLRFLRR